MKDTPVNFAAVGLSARQLTSQRHDAVDRVAVECHPSPIRSFGKHYGRKSARILVAAVAVGTVLRTLALLLKYPPLSRRRLDLLRGKLAACRRLLRGFWRPATTQASKEALS